MRHRMIIAALMAGSAFSPVLAQEVDATIAAETRLPSIGVVQPRGMAAAVQDERRDRGGGDRGPRQDWQQRQRERPQIQTQETQVQAQTQPQSQAQGQQPDWSARRAERMGGRMQGNWDRRDTQPPPPPAAQNTGNWNRDADRRTPGQGDWHPRDDRWGNRDGNRGRDDNRPPQTADRGWQNRDADRRWDHPQNPGWHNDRRWDNHRTWNDGGQSWGTDNRRWNRDWRQDRRYDWERYRYSNRDLYRMPRYSSPYGYGYRYERFDVGITLDSIFFGSRYRISDPWRYRLPDAQWPYEWIRYYDDVLLVDTRNGYVVDVIYDFFW